MENDRRILILVMLMAFCCRITLGSDGELNGSGTSSSPYLIYDLDDFYVFADPANADKYWSENVYTRLRTNINLSEMTYSQAVIAPNSSFKGNFDGNNNVIFNLTINANGPNQQYIGFFSENEGTIKNLGLVHFKIKSQNDSLCFGGITGQNTNGYINNTYCIGEIVCGDNSEEIGGLCGSNLGTIESCYAGVSVISGNDSYYIGGLCGINYDGVISKCNSSGKNNSRNDTYYIGGLCGGNFLGIIENCYSTVAVNGGKSNYYLGGLTGDNFYGEVEKCYSTGAVTADTTSDYLGGLCGDNYFGTVKDSFWDYQASNIEVSAGGIGLPTESMQNIDTFMAAGWYIRSNYNNNADWLINEGDYPDLLHESFNCIPGIGAAYCPFEIHNIHHWDIFTDPDNSEIYYSENIHTVLMDNLTLSSNYYRSPVNMNYSGIFDGIGHTINNLNIIRTNDNTGLFRYLTGSGEIKNIGLYNSTINCEDGDDSIGAICGYSYGKITQCFAECDFDFEGTGYYFGIICGYNRGIISNCYSKGYFDNKSTSNYLGGICGYNLSGTIEKCYSNANIRYPYSGKNLGGIVGYKNNSGTIENCFWDAEVSLGIPGDDNYGATGKKTEDMQTEDTFTSAGWDFFGETVNGSNDLWIMKEYPEFIWQHEPVIMPNVEGLTLTEAEEIFNIIGLIIGNIEYEYNEGVDNGNIISQKIPEGQDTVVGKKIDLIVSFPTPGLGTEEHPYLIENISDFISFADPNYADFFWAKGVFTQLCSDLNFDPNNIYENISINGYNGIFDGNGHSINKLKLEYNGHSGIFAEVRSFGRIVNLSINEADFQVNGSNNGILCGTNRGKISNCMVIDSSIKGASMINTGGICGNNFGTIISCFANCRIEISNTIDPNEFADINHNIGGLCGTNAIMIESSYSDCLIVNDFPCYSIGGLCGQNYEPLGGTAQISNCYSIGNITSNYEVEFAGGLCGENLSSNIEYCYAAVNIAGSGTTEAFCGTNQDGIITGCFWDTDTFTRNTGYNNFGAIGKSTEEMQSISTFISANWDLSYIDGTAADWAMLDSSYPKLAWEVPMIDPDLDLNGKVDIRDFAFFASSWLSSDCFLSHYCSGSDLDKSGDVTFDDFELIIKDWMQ